MKAKSLRPWLRREPAPDKVVVRLEDGEERKIAIPADIRNRWKTVEASIWASGCVAVTLFDKKGEVLRAQDLEQPDDDEEDDSPEAKVATAQAKNLKEWTTMLQAVMHEQNVSFEKGVHAASQSQDSLVELVGQISAQLSNTFVSLHNVVGTMAQMQQTAADREARLTTDLAQARSEAGSETQDPVAAAAIAGIVRSLIPGTPAASEEKKHSNGKGKRP
jgi:hypothetical protein